MTRSYVAVTRQSQGPGFWLDNDLLTVGCNDHAVSGTPCDSKTPLTLTEERTQFSMWAIMASPLILSSDLRYISNNTLDIIGNTEVIAVNQARAGRRRGKG